MTAKKKAKKTAKSTTAHTRGKRGAAKRESARKSKKKKLQKKAAVKQKFIGQVIAPGRERAQSRGQSGDLQGLSDVAQADSESVDELLDEGNPFEASVVSGVEGAGDADEREVHTREVPEDDVPDEYLDNDK